MCYKGTALFHIIFLGGTFYNFQFHCISVPKDNGYPCKQCRTRSVGTFCTISSGYKLLVYIMYPFIDFKSTTNDNNFGGIEKSTVQKLSPLSFLSLLTPTTDLLLQEETENLWSEFILRL